MTGRAGNRERRRRGARGSGDRRGAHPRPHLPGRTGGATGPRIAAEPEPLERLQHQLGDRASGARSSVRPALQATVARWAQRQLEVVERERDRAAGRRPPRAPAAPPPRRRSASIPSTSRATSGGSRPQGHQHGQREDALAQVAAGRLADLRDRGRRGRARRRRSGTRCRAPCRSGRAPRPRLARAGRRGAEPAARSPAASPSCRGSRRRSG